MSRSNVAQRQRANQIESTNKALIQKERSHFGSEPQPEPTTKKFRRMAPSAELLLNQHYDSKQQNNSM